MATFKIVEIVKEEREVEADSAQEALEIYLNAGEDHPQVSGTVTLDVTERWVEDEDGNTVETVGS